MSQPNLYGHDLVSSPQANRRGRRNTVDNPILIDSELFAPSFPQDLQERTIPRLRRWTEEHRENNPVVPRNIDPLDQSMQDVALDDEEDEEPDDWDMVLDYLAVEESEDWYPRPTTMSRVRRYLWPRDEDEDEDQHHHRRPEPLVFDDEGLATIDEEDEDEDDRPDWRDPAWDYNIPFGPRVQYDYTFEQLYPRTARALDFAQSLPGMRRLAVARDVVAAWAPTVQNNIVRTYKGMAPRTMFTAQRTQEVLTMSAQVGSQLAVEAWSAGQNAAQMVQETWEAAQPTLRMLREGRAMRLLIEGDVMMMLLQDAAMAGLSAIPPYDLILRSGGGRRRL
ncbi:hypothetical protein Neosp_007632 [[Neocosmospora] mangrovei]